MKLIPLLFLSLLCCAAEFCPLQIKGMLFTQMEVARTPESREKGLMHRTYLPQDGGMLFIMEAPQVLHFWMRNTRIPLDIIYLDDKGVIVAIHTMKVEHPQRLMETNHAYCRRLPSYSSEQPAKYAIELNAGMAAMLQLKPGEQIQLPIIK